MSDCAVPKFSLPDVPYAGLVFREAVFFNFCGGLALTGGGASVCWGPPSGDGGAIKGGVPDEPGSEPGITTDKPPPTIAGVARRGC